MNNENLNLQLKITDSEERGCVCEIRHILNKEGSDYGRVLRTKNWISKIRVLIEGLKGKVLGKLDQR